MVTSSYQSQKKRTKSGRLSSLSCSESSLTITPGKPIISRGEPILTDEPPSADTEIKPDDSEAVQMIKEIIDTRV